LRKQLQEKIATTLAVLSDRTDATDLVAGANAIEGLKELSNSLNGESQSRSQGVQSYDDATKKKLETTLKRVTETEERVRTRSHVRKAALAEQERAERE
jgi:uncharacterized phage infection (PIP) family protein YhgE